jgi:3alpha(or 20beta)-hydroxysteroid dehydrogenase
VNPNTIARLDGKVALIAGGANGMGAAEVRLLAQQGALVVAADIADDDGELLAKEIPAVEYLHLDVTSEHQWDEVVADVVDRHDGIDIFVNNAGIYAGRAITKLALEDWDRTIAVNQTGVMLGIRAVGRAMIARGLGGAIVSISSVAGLNGPYGGTSYCASKWAVRGMSRVAAKEFGPHGIRVNSIYPGYIQTDMLDVAIKGMDRDKIIDSIPLRRIGQPTDIADVVLFLVSDLSAYCTGQEFVVDGGIHG